MDRQSESGGSNKTKLVLRITIYLNVAVDVVRGYSTGKLAVRGYISYLIG